ncbi:MAG: response regulator transcription factor [Actinomycetota bacterium]|jgi:two-component system KDP operon response regulator KdpE|nr:response regulator transcription factor [Actinomycetota bacterium]
MARLLVVDDDPALVKVLRISLTARGDEVVVARTGADALQQAASLRPDVVILDLGLPDVDGVEVCRRIRQWSEMPIVVLSAAGDEQRKVSSLDAGADDYVTKPFGMAELQARLRVALRHGADRAGDHGAVELTVGPLVVDAAHHTATLEGHVLELTAREFDLLAYLARHAGKVCTHHLLLQAVWGTGYGTESNYLRVYAHRLRRKLGDAGTMLRTHPGIGYQLTDDDTDPADPPPRTARSR